MGGRVMVTRGSPSSLLSSSDVEYPERADDKVALSDPRGETGDTGGSRLFIGVGEAVESGPSATADSPSIDVVTAIFGI
jgi:hypothetical protein